MLRRTQLVVAAGAMALAIGCGKGGDESAPREAGSVTEISGDVTAVRGGEPSTPRALSRGAVVFSDDTITTDRDATVTIALTHNGARWTLGGDTARRVDQSSAWRAPTGSDEATFVTGDPDRTASAGRHTEPVPEIERRAEAETDDEVMPHAAPPPAPAAAAPPPPPKPKPKTSGRMKHKKKAPPKEDRKKMRVEDLLGDEVEDGEQSLTHNEIIAGIKKVLPAVRKCGDEHGVENVVVKVKILIAKDGSVSGAVPTGDHAKSDLGRCVSDRVRAARFRANSGPPSVLYPFKI